MRTCRVQPAGEAPSPGAAGGGTYGFAFGTGVSLVAWGTGFALEVEGKGKKDAQKRVDEQKES